MQQRDTESQSHREESEQVKSPTALSLFSVSPCLRASVLLAVPAHRGAPSLRKLQNEPIAVRLSAPNAKCAERTHVPFCLTYAKAPQTVPNASKLFHRARRRKTNPSLFRGTDYFFTATVFHVLA